MSGQIFKSKIAKRLKTLRKEKGLSLDATAKLTNVSKAMLGQIEREESSPTIAVLWKIASGLNASFSSFFSNQNEADMAQRIFPNDQNMQVKTLFAFSQDSAMEMFEITLTNHHKQLSSAHSTGVIEHIVVRSGCLSVFYDDTWHNFEAGQTCRFFSDQSHGYQAVSESCVFENIICYPK